MSISPMVALGVLALLFFAPLILGLLYGLWVRNREAIDD